MRRIIIGHIININKTFWFSKSLRYSCFFSSFLKWIDNLRKGVESYNCSYFPYISIVWFYRSCEFDLSCVKWYQSKPFLGSSIKLVHNNNHGEQQAWQSWFPYGGLSFWWPSEQHGRFEETSSAIFGASSMLQNSKSWWWKSRFLGCQPFSFSHSCGWARWRGVRGVALTKSTTTWCWFEGHSWVQREDSTRWVHWLVEYGGTCFLFKGSLS